MLVNVVGNPVDLFLDSNGQPLQGGSIYIGQPNTDPTNPANQITVYQDAGLTIPFQQPIKTINGQPAMNGSQAIIYLGLGVNTYSLAVFNAGGVAVMSIPVVAPTSLGGSAGGSMTDEVGKNGQPGFLAGTDFTAGTTTSLQLSRNYGAVSNLWVAFDAAEQGADTLSLGGANNQTLTFNAPIPVGTTKVYVKGGTTNAIGTPANGTVTDATVSPSAAIQSTKIDFIQSGVGAIHRTALSKMRERVTPFDFGAVGDGTTIDDAAINAAAAAAVSLGVALDMSGKFAVTHIPIPTGLRHIKGDCILLGQTSGTYSAVLEIKNIVDLTISGTMLVAGQYNTGYACGVKVWADQASGCSLISLNNISVSSCKVGWQFGDPAQVDTLVSEITVSGGYTYGCPIACSAYGTQTFVDFVGYILQSSYGTGTGSWTSLPARVVQALGASVSQDGGEFLMPTITTGAGVELDPITSVSFTNNYGTYKGNGVIVECASPFVITGAAGVSSPVNGLISFIGCTGIHTQNSQALIQTDASFSGRIILQGNNFYCSTPRTFANIACSGNADIYCDDVSFGKNFLGPLAGISGGIPHFTKRTILRASNLGGQSFPSATNTDMKFTVVDNTGDLARFSSGYSPSTGVFTVPNGGLQDVEISTRIYYSGLGSTALYIEVNNLIMSVEPSPANGGGTVYNAGSLVAGTQIKATLNNGGGSIAVGSNPWDFLQITARN
jgi:hypothetical protein